MRIVLVCHGEGPSADEQTPLSKRGKLQADAIAREVSTDLAVKQPVAALYASPSLPALTTAAIIADKLGVTDPLSIDRLAGDTAAPDAAMLRSLQAAAWSSIEGWRESHAPDDQIVLVAGVATIVAVVCRALSMPVEDYRRFRIDLASITTIEFRAQQQRTILVSLNETCHLANT